ncbi:hypothetical protein CBR_g25795 [Chara braunii]|uniref:DUF4360 domain-containing protein n=1 Tax=Chara braunii TaxID=69332 RepID=A0A388L6N0_CHABU|nr:hypothetical protein CBR_g25795 [Chara braunii]|eukprot:GBG77863.1 hypothetical protein CBR_g25795 [Chara braunii]
MNCAMETEQAVTFRYQLQHLKLAPRTSSDGSPFQQSSSDSSPFQQSAATFPRKRSLAFRESFGGCIQLPTELATTSAGEEPSTSRIEFHIPREVNPTASAHNSCVPMGVSYTSSDDESEPLVATDYSSGPQSSSSGPLLHASSSSTKLVASGYSSEELSTARASPTQVRSADAIPIESQSGSEASGRGDTERRAILQILSAPLPGEKRRRELREVASAISSSTAFKPRRGSSGGDSRRTAPGAANLGGCYLLPSRELLICCWARGDRTKVRRKAKTKRIRHRLFQSVSTMAAMVVLLLLGLIQLAVPGLAQIPPFGTVKIEQAISAGTGCPPDSTRSLVSADQRFLTVLFSSFNVSTGNPGGRRKNCRLAVNLIYPAGFTFTLVTVRFQGYADLEPGVNGTLAAAYYFSDIGEPVKTLRNLPSPKADYFDYADNFTNLIYPQCNSTSVMIIINSEARVVPPPPPSSMSGSIGVDSQDVSLTQSFGLSWKIC